MLVIFPFEEKVYEDAGVPVTFVGHPLVDLVAPERDRAAFLAANGPRSRAARGRPPARAAGARRSRTTCPPLAGAVAAARAAAARPPVPGRGRRRPSTRARCARRSPPTVALVQGRTHAVLSAATAAVVASGTATVEAALLGTPMVVVYRLSALTYHLGRRFVNVPHVAMANLIAEKGIVPELIQDEFTPERVAAAVLPLLGPEGERCARLWPRSGGGWAAPGASGRAADGRGAAPGRPKKR